MNFSQNRGVLSYTYLMELSLLWALSKSSIAGKCIHQKDHQGALTHSLIPFVHLWPLFIFLPQWDLYFPGTCLDSLNARHVSQLKIPVPSTKTTLYSQKLTMLMMVSPWMFRVICWFASLWHFQNRTVIYMLLFNVSRGFVLFCFSFSFRSSKNGIGGGEERVSLNCSLLGDCFIPPFIQSSKNVAMFQPVRLNISLEAIRGVILKADFEEP